MPGPLCPKCKKQLDFIYRYSTVKTYIPIVDGDIQWDDEETDYYEHLEYSITCPHCGYQEYDIVIEELPWDD